MIARQCKVVFFFLSFFSICFFNANGQNETVENISQVSKIKNLPRTVYNFPPPFDTPDFPFKVVELTTASPKWAQLLYDDNPNIFKIMELHQAWRKVNPDVKNGHTRNYKKLIGYLMENQGVNDQGFIDLPEPQETKAEQKRILKDRKKFSEQNNSAALRSNNNTTWQLIGPDWMKYTNGQLANAQINVYSITQSLTNPDILYCVTEAGGTIFKTIDNGLNWFSVSDNLLESMGSRNIEVAPSNPDVVYISTQHDIYKTTDGGTTWNSVLYSYNMGGRTILIHPSDPNILFIGGNNGIQKTTDGGSTWTTVLPNASIYDIRYQPGNSQVIYSLVDNSTTKQTDFYKSTDGGNTWSVRDTGWPNEPSTSNRGGQMTTSDGNDNIIFAFIGATWTSSNNTRGIKILKSSDYGETWTLKVDYDNVKNINSGQGFYDWDIEMSDVDSNIVAFGTQGSWISYDGLETVTTDMRHGWSGHADIQEMLFNGDEIWVVNDGGVTKYENDSLYNYDVRSKTINAISYWSFDQGWNKDVNIGTHYHNGTSAMHENYEDNIAINLGGAEPAFSLVAQPNAEKVVSKGYGSVNGKVMPDDQNGAFTSFNYNLTPNRDYYDGTSICIDLLHHNTHYAALENKVMKSTNFGVGWDTLATFSKTNEYIEVIDVTRANTDVMYVGSTHSSGSSLYRSADRGASFVEIPIPYATNNFHISVSNEDENIVFIGGDRKYSSDGKKVKVGKTIDGGATWIDLWTPTLEDYDFRKIMQVDGTNGGVYLLTTRAVFYRNNTLTDWVALTNGIPANASWGYIKPFYRENQLRVATSRGTFGADLYETPQLSNILLQPTVNKRDVTCGLDTLFFEDYSVVEHNGATWTWTFPGASYVSNYNVRNPKVVYAQAGQYDVTMSITKDGQTFTKTIEHMIEVGNGCDNADTIAGKAMKFNGTSSDKIQLDGMNVTTNTFTISAWIKPNGGQNGFTGIVSNGVWCAHCNDQTLGLSYNYHGDRLYYRWPNSTSGWAGNSGMYIPQNEWSYVAMVMSPDKVTLYLNEQKWEQNISHAPADISILYIGDGHYSGFFNGEMDEVSVWNKSLTEVEIKELMHLTKDPSQDPDLLAYYQFNETEGDAISKTGIAHGSVAGEVTRITSTAPIGGGNSDTQTEMNGSVTFPNVGLEINYINQSNVEIVASKIDQTPYNVNGLLQNDTPLDDQYWAVHRYGTGSYEASFIFQTNENLTVADENAPCRLALYGRGNRSDEDWNYIGTATSVNANNNTATFFNSDNYLQYIVTRSDEPIMRANNSIVLKNTLVGNVSEEVSYEFNAANLINNGLITAPLGFEISLTSGSGFTTSLNLTPVNGKISETIYVQYTPTQTSLHHGIIQHTSVGALNLDVDVEGLGFELDRIPGTALDLDGSSDYVNLGNPSELQITGDLTIQMWVKPSNFSARRNPIGKAYGGEYAITQETNGTLTFYNGQSGGNSGGYQQLTSNAALIVNEWNHITIVRDITNAQWTWYINGEQTNQSTMSNTSIVAGNNSIYIGEGYVSGYAGFIDEVRIWKIPLTEQQIREQMHLTLKGDDVGLVSYFQFNEPSGNAKDLIGGIDGTFVNQATRSLATEPVGGGFSNTQMEVNGNVSFSNTNFTSDFILQNGATVVASKIELSPNDNNGIGANETPADNQYWVVNRYGTGSLDANLTFTLSEDLSAAEEATPNSIKLYGRNNTSDGNWTFISNANNVVAATDEVTFNNVSAFEQFLITRNPFPKIDLANVVLNFGNINKDSTSTELQYTVSGTDLTNNLLINAPNGFEISLTSGSGFSNSLTLTPNTGSIATTTIYVRFTPSTATYFFGEITHASVGATNRNLNVEGTGVIPEIELRQEATLLSNNSTVDFGSHQIGETNSLTFSIKNKDLGLLSLLNSPKITLTGAHASDFTIDETATATSLVENETTIFIINFTPSANGIRTANISITTNDLNNSPFVLNLTGNGEALPEISIVENLIPFDLQLENTVSSVQSYSISGTSLSEKIIISTTPGFEISLNSSSGFSSESLFLNPTNGTLASTNIYVRFKPLGVADYNGTILHSSSQAITQTINLSGKSYQLAEQTPGNAMYFDGTDQYVGVDNNSIFQFGTSTDFTVALWIKTDNWVDDASIASNKDWDSGGNVGWNLALGTDNQGIDVNVGDGSNRADLQSGNLNDGDWHHIAATFDRDGEVSLYVDGVLEESTSMAAVGNINNNLKITFGADAEYDYEYKGFLDEAKIWTTALTAQEIREAMHLTSEWNTPNLIAYYQFNESNFNAVYNLKGSTHGTMENGVARVASSVPVGGGMVSTMTEANGVVSFPNTNFETNFTNQNDAEVVVSRINLSPNIIPTNLPRVFDAQYWAINRYGTGNFLGDLTFTVSEDLTTLDESNPSQIILYGRGANTDTTWQEIGTALSVDAGMNQATFEAIDNFDQFLVASSSSGGDLNCQTDVYYENTLALPDTTKSSTFIEAGNLTGIGEVQILNTQTILFEANDILLQPGFVAMTGSDFTATIENCTPLALTQNDPEYFDIESPVTNFSSGVELSVFPNPSKQEFTISYHLETPSTIQLQLYDVLGKRVRNILGEQFQDEGFHQLDFVHNDLRTGTYILILQIDDLVIYEKVLIQN